MLLGAIMERTTNKEELAGLTKAKAQAEEMAKACNDRLQNLDDTQTMKTINSSLDFSRIQNPDQVFMEGRRLVKRGLVHIAVLSSSGKIVKSKPIEMILLTDMIIYGKRTRAKKCLVYKQVHRSFIEVKAKEGKPDMFEIKILSSKGSTKINLRCDTTGARDRWVKVFNPSADRDNGGESVYEDWDCPQVRAVKDWTPPSTAGDDLALRVGDIINVSAKDEAGYYKGTIIRTIHTTHRKTTGWFPQKFCKELPSVHHQAKMYRAQHEKMRQNSADESLYATAFK